MKVHLLETLLAFDEFCHEHNLRYYLSGGTLLGAIRHKGFIPWDDDVDVNMPRPDCEKLMALSGGRIGRMTLLPPNFDNEYHAYHWKLFNDSVLVTKRDPDDPLAKIKPIHLDIFPIDGLPDTEQDNVRHYRKIFVYKQLHNCTWDRPWFSGKTRKRKLVHACLRPIALLMGRERLYNDVIGVAKSLPYEDSKYVGVMMTNCHTTEERVVKAEYEPVVDVTFEGHTLPAPANYDTYLRQLYGNYMELPPEKKRHGKHQYNAYLIKPEGKQS